MMNNFRNMLICCFADDALLLPVLWQGQNRIGVQASLIDRRNRSLISLLNGRDLNIKRPPPGFILHLECIRWGIENQFAVYDLQTGNFPYKYELGGIERRVECLRIRTTDRRNLRGKLEPLSLPVVFDHAQQLRQQGKFDAATDACRQILDVEPGHEKARRLLAWLGTQQQRAVPANLTLAKEFHQRGQLGDAEKAYNAILRADPKHFDAAYLLGLVFLQQKKFEAAERQIGSAIRMQPDVAGLHYNRGLALFYLERLDEALASFDAAIALKPDYSLAINQRENVLKRARV